MKRTLGEKIFNVVNYIILALIMLITLYPFYDVLRISFSTPAEALSTQFRLFPSEISLDAYKYVIQNEYIWIGYLNTIKRLLLAVPISMTLMIMGAYALSKRNLPHRTFWTMAIVFTMFFNGGLIPTYLLINDLNLNNTIWALVLPRAVDTFGLLIMRNFFMSIPAELEESAVIDGANTIQILIKIIIPISLPIIMTVGMWVLVWHWNSWFDCLIYIKDPDKYVLQAVLRKIIVESTAQFDSMNNLTIETTQKPNDEVIKAATIFVSTFPILCIYPFIQKYFVKGVMVGSLKG